MAPKSNSPTKQDSTSTTPASQAAESGAHESAGKSVNGRFEVFSIKSRGEKDSIWVRSGSAWLNRDGSINVYLDILPLDGKLHIREPRARTEAASAPASDASC